MPSSTMLWGEWKALYPDTMLILGIEDVRDTLFAEDAYGKILVAGIRTESTKNGSHSQSMKTNWTAGCPPERLS